MEPFGGSAVVLLNKRPAKVEAYNDLNEAVVNFFRILRDRPNDLYEQLRHMPWSRIEHSEAKKTLKYDQRELQRAVAVFVLHHMGFSGKIDDSWGFARTCSRNGRASLINKYRNAVERLLSYRRRLLRVQIECDDFAKVIKRFDHQDTLFYCDPPYVHTTRTEGKAYLYEMNEEDHVRLANSLNTCKGQVAISGYESDLYNEIYPSPKWNKSIKDISVRSHNTTGKKARRTEVLWKNYLIS